MTFFNSNELKKDMTFEFRHFQPFYEEISSRKKITDIQRIKNAISNAPDFFDKCPEVKRNLISQIDKINIRHLTKECESFLQEVSVPDDSTLNKLIRTDDSARWLVCFGERLGGYCAVTGISSSQIRNVYGQIKSLEMGIAKQPANNQIDAISLRKILVLIPRLAYAAKREGGGLIQLSDIFSSAIKLTETVGDFMRLSQFFEATLAYHKAYGGK